MMYTMSMTYGPACAGFIDYDQVGKPFMGLIFEDGGIQLKIYLAHKDNAINVAAEFTEQVKKMARDLQREKDKIMPVQGNMEGIDGLIRKPPRG